MPETTETPVAFYDDGKKVRVTSPTPAHVHQPKEVHLRGSIRLMCDCGSWLGDKPLPAAP